ncbi:MULTISPECIES: hypothetical protein [Bacillus]|uniref:hypothetical protein n=1 Tax=Bacillus TaxID=1386 RepID=UPI000BA71140|nr:MULTISPECIES: hypothetical protein [Bacillus]MDH3097121.1 hypothetical protein [Bacillus safensis]MDI6562385.1 hypothetical protein [Bacillus altitudinis]PAK34123.1 hypothetical protein CHI04_12605 [Bacillus safensis]USD79699.1 hypothetical protein M5E03_03070 [Bacillus safensis]
MKNIDVYALAQKIDEKIQKDHLEETKDIFNEFRNKDIHSIQNLNEILVNLIALSHAKNKEFTIELIQKVVDELNSEV